MGGYGSGQYYRWGNKKTTVEESKRIDIRWMKQQGYLSPGYNGSIYWTRAGEPSGNIRVIVEWNSTRFIYRYRYAGQNCQDVDIRVKLDRTPCNYGGERSWFICPFCGRRCAVLYIDGKHPACRKCYDLTYESCQKSGNIFDMALLHLNSIERKIGVPESQGLNIRFPKRPKGMHHDTYRRLLFEWFETKDYVIEAFQVRVRSFSGMGK